MRILALITARGGSKRLPGKNIRVLGDKPLVVWSIDVAKDIPEICDILVSTDDPVIAGICREAGALVPWLRPDYLATDVAVSVDVVLHALEWYEVEKGTVDGVLLLQPTSPFRTKETMLKGIDLYKKNDQCPVLGVAESYSHPMWALKIEDEYLVPYMNDHGLSNRSQDLSQAFMVSGSFYLISPAELRKHRSFLGEKMVPLLIKSPQEALDIDTEWDWKIAEIVLAAMTLTRKT